jgi:hypothetical protein
MGVEEDIICTDVGGYDQWIDEERKECDDNRSE